VSCPDGPAESRRHPHIPSAFNRYIAANGIRTYPSGVYAIGVTNGEHGLFMPPLDCDGWAIDPNTAAPAFTVYVDSTSDSLEEPDGTIARPYRSLACAFLAVRGGSNYPAMARKIRVRRGSVYYETIGQQNPGGDSNICVPGYTWDVPNGGGPDQPFIVEAYGEPPEFGLGDPRFAPGNPRFVIVASNFNASAPGVFIRGGASDFWLRNAEVVSESEWNYGFGQPRALSLPPNSGVQLSNVNRVYLEDCYIRGFQFNVRVDGTTAPQPFNAVTMHRCILADNYGVLEAGGQSSGVFANRSSMLISECLFIDNGWSDRWRPGTGSRDPGARLPGDTLGMGSDLNQGIYWSFNMDRSLILDTMIIRPSFAAAQIRANDNSAWNCAVLDAPAAIRGGHAQGDNGPPEGGAELDGLVFGDCGLNRPADVEGPPGFDWSQPWPADFGWRGEMGWCVALGAADVYARAGAPDSTLPGPMARGMGFGATLSYGAKIHRCISASNAPRNVGEVVGENFFNSNGASEGRFGGIYCDYGNSAFYRIGDALSENDELARLWDTENKQLNKPLTIQDCIIFDWDSLFGGAPAIDLRTVSDNVVGRQTNVCEPYPRRVFGAPTSWVLDGVTVKQRAPGGRVYAGFGILGTGDSTLFYAPNLNAMRAGGFFRDVRFNISGVSAGSTPGGTYRDGASNQFTTFEQLRAAVGRPTGVPGQFEGQGISESTSAIDNDVRWPPLFATQQNTLNLTTYMSEKNLLDPDRLIFGKMTDFTAMCRTQSRYKSPTSPLPGNDNWDDRLTARGVNGWVRSKFGWSEEATR
ncbi:MAG TPA: hypothetical protein VK157_14885, partial [Phycisphaerales bacterium]|nr:hypothetical protein [Phycisphaerales bacterium]